MIRAHFRLLSILLGISLLGVVSVRADDSKHPHQIVNLPVDRPLIIAHRGYSSRAPENTIAAFRMAREAKVDLIELDYLHAKDGVPVVFHDGTLDRTTDAIARGGAPDTRVADRTAAELAGLDAGLWFGESFAGERIPTLNAAIDEIQRDNVTLIERKGGDAETLVELLRKKRLVNEVVVQAFDWEFLKEFHRREPDQLLGALGPGKTLNRKPVSEWEKPLSVRWLDELAPTGARLVVWNRQVTREAVAEANRRGLAVWVYTINNPAEARQLVELGVQGIITDRPTAIRETLQ